MNKLDMQSTDIVKDNIEKIAQMFPNVVVESDKGMAIDFDLLKQELSKDIVEIGKEKYQLTWPGKKEAIVNANTPINKTLRPIREKSVNFDDTKNIYIEGDNLEVLKILQESYLNKIKCIYIDPPYNTGNDFIYNDNFKKTEIEENLDSGVIDEQGNRLVKNNLNNSRFHSKWLSMLYPRIKLSRTLMTQDGIIFISIDDNELNNVITICDEIFGANNFVGVFPRITKKSGKAHSETIAKNNDYIVVYTRDIDSTIFSGIDGSSGGYDNSDEYENSRGKYKLNQTLDYDSLWYNPTMDFPLEIDGNTYYPGGDVTKYNDRHNGIHNSKDWVWRWSKAKFEFGYKNGFIVIKKGKDRPRIYTKTYLNASINKDSNGKYYIEYKDRKNVISSLTFIENEYSNDNSKKELDKYDMGGLFDFSKPSKLIEQLIKLNNITEDFYVLDYFSGSATTAESVLKYNSKNKIQAKFILVQLPENNNENNYKTICDIGEERIRRAANKIKEETNADIDYGFRVYKVDSSNMKDVYYKPNELKQSELRLFETNIKEDRTPDDLLTQVILDLGLTLDLNVEEKMIGNNKVYYVAGNSLVACFDDRIDINIVDEICKCEPYKVVFKDSSFENDNDKINLQEKFKKLLPDRANDIDFINIL